MKPTDLLTLSQAADIAGLNPGTLRVQIHNGQLEAEKRGRDWLVTRKALNDYLKNVARAGKPKPPT